MPMQRPQSAASTRSARSASGDSHRSTSTGASRLRADHVWLQPLPGVGNAEQIAAIQDALSPSKADARLSTATPVKPTRSQRRSSNETPRQRRPATAPSRRGPPSPECLSPEKFAALSHPSSGAPEVDAFTMKRMQSPLRDRDVKGRQRRAEATPSPVIQQKKLREEAIARRPSQIQQRQMREEAIARQQSQQIQRRASRDDATQTEPAKKKTRKKPVPELQLESPATEDPLQSVVAGREEPTRTSVNLTRPRTASVETPPQGYTSWETLVGKDDLGSLYEANRRLSSEDLIKTYRARPSTAPRPGSRYAYLKKKGSIHTPGRIFHGNHWLRGRHVEAVAEGDPFLYSVLFFSSRPRVDGVLLRRGQKKVLEVNPARLMFDKAVQDAELEDELLTRHEQRSLGINEKRHIVNLHRTHNYNVANIEAATSHHRDRHCDEYFDYRKEMRRKMIARTTKKTPTPYTVRRATRAEIVEHQERNVLILNHCVRNATAKTVCHLDDKVNNARKLRRTKHKREAAGPVAHVLGILRKREARQRKSHAVYVASSKDPFVGAGEEAPGAAPAFDTFARSQTCAPRSKTEALMLAQERRDLAAVCGRDQVSTVMALNPGDATLFDKRFRKSMEKRGLYF